MMINLPHGTHKRYQVQAKRKDESKKKWAEWTEENHYKDAIVHAKRIEALGHCGRVIPCAAGVEKLWGILGGDTDKADEIFDAGFRLESDTARTIFSSIDRAFLKKLKSLNDEINIYDEEGNEELALGLKKQRAAIEEMREIVQGIAAKYKESEDDEGDIQKNV